MIILSINVVASALCLMSVEAQVNTPIPPITTSDSSSAFPLPGPSQFSTAATDTSSKPLGGSIFTTTNSLTPTATLPFSSASLTGGTLTTSGNVTSTGGTLTETNLSTTGTFTGSGVTSVTSPTRTGTLTGTGSSTAAPPSTSQPSSARSQNQAKALVPLFGLLLAAYMS